jgi:hypothetical protein
MTLPSGGITRIMPRITSRLRGCWSKQTADETAHLPVSNPFLVTRSPESTKSRYVFKETNCSVCLDLYSEKKSRTYPFNCPHEICFPCFRQYVKVQQENKHIRCVMCKAPLRSGWTSSSARTIYCREIGPSEGIFVPLPYSNGNTSAININTRQDTTQYQLAHGRVQDNSRLRDHVIETSVFHHTIIRIQSWARMMFHRKLYLDKRTNVVRLQRFVRRRA